MSKSTNQFWGNYELRSTMHYVGASYNDHFDVNAVALKDKAEKERIQLENEVRTKRLQAVNRKFENNDNEPPMIIW